MSEIMQGGLKLCAAVAVSLVSICGIAYGVAGLLDLWRAHRKRRQN